MEGNSKKLEVIYTEKERVLQLRCTNAFSSIDFRDALLNALAIAEKQQIKHWLLDLKEIGELYEEDETWVYTQLFPKMMMTLGTGNYMAMLISEACYARLLDEAGKQGLTSCNSFIILQNFCNLNEAKCWLHEHTDSAA